MSSTTNQLSLNITPRHAYAPENFMPHAGVVDLLKHCSDGPGRMLSSSPSSLELHAVVRPISPLSSARPGCSRSFLVDRRNGFCRLVGTGGSVGKGRRCYCG